MNSVTMAFDAILFDLDGTLYDSAPDLAACANRLRTRRSMPPLQLHHLRPFAGQGARGLIKASLGISADHPDYKSIEKEFLNDYEAHCLSASGLFAGVTQTLNRLKELSLPWGIVTNKHARFVIPILKATGLHDSCSCLVCGDAPGAPKPSPEHLLLALETLHTDPARTLYVGDDERDAQAARAAGMPFAAACYGYLGQEPDITRWQAQLQLASLHDLLNHL